MLNFLKPGMASIVQQASNVLLLVLLGIGAAHGALAPNKPYKVCPNNPEPKDFPCVAMSPTATIAVRAIAPPPPIRVATDSVKIEEDKTAAYQALLSMKNSEIAALKEEVELLNKMLRDLMDREIKRQSNVTIPNQEEK